MQRTFLSSLGVIGLSSGIAFLWEWNYVLNSMEASGIIVSFRHKQISSAQGDTHDMMISFKTEGKERRFLTGRNVIEQLMGRYHVGDRIPVIYNPGGYPQAKIGYLSHRYKITLVFMVLGVIVLIGFSYGLFKKRRES